MFYNPPYPGDGATIDLVWFLLGELRTWALTQKEELLIASPETHIPAPLALPKKTVYHTQPVVDLFAHFQFLRRLREAHDHLVRLFETAQWDSPQCVQQRVMLITIAIQQINETTIPFEVKEARAENQLDKLQKIFDQLTSQYRATLEPYDVQ